MSEKLLRIYGVAITHTRFTERERLMAAAVTATEMQMRGFMQRMAEYILVCAILLLGKDAQWVSVGISQISLRHYYALADAKGFKALFMSLSPSENLRMCCILINSTNAVNLDDLANAYNGKSTVFYRSCLKQNYAAINSLHQRVSCEATCLR